MAALPAQRDLPFDSASERCEDAIRLLSTGKGNIIRRIEAFRKLGVVPKKELAARMIEASDLDETKEIKVDAGAAA